MFVYSDKNIQKRVSKKKKSFDDNPSELPEVQDNSCQKKKFLLRIFSSSFSQAFPIIFHFSKYLFDIFISHVSAQIALGSLFDPWPVSYHRVTS